MSVHGTMGLLKGCPDADPKFGEAIERVLTSFDARSALPWGAQSVCSCCGSSSCKI